MTASSNIEHLRQKFALGITGSLPFADEIPLTRTLGVHISTIGSSHFCSAADIVLGSMRFAVNNMENADKREVALTMLRQLLPMAIGRASLRNRDLTINYSPVSILAPAYLADYAKLHAFLGEAGWKPIRAPSH